VHCAFVFDSEILDALPHRADRRVKFIHESLVELDTALDGLSRRAGDAGALCRGPGPRGGQRGMTAMAIASSRPV
jgi:hypothetical protein